MEHDKKGVSIVICTNNGKKNIAPTLEHIAAQKYIESIPTELLIVDNASTDGTADFAKQKWSTLDSIIPLRVIYEGRTGKTYATITGFTAATYEYIIICDDDNWLSDNYVKRAYDILSDNERIGVLGGRGEAVFETEKPYWFDNYQSTFAVGDQCEVTGDVTDKINSLWGAGMVFRKSIWNSLQKIGCDFFLNYVSGHKEILGGEDSELCERIRILGYILWFDNNMKYIHYMPASRMNLRYLKRRFYGLGRARLYMHAYIYCRTNETMPKSQLKYPLWMDKWIYLAKEYINEAPKYIFSYNAKDLDGYLKFMALKGELHEIWRLKNAYSEVFRKILGFRKKAKDHYNLRAQ